MFKFLLLTLLGITGTMGQVCVAPQNNCISFTVGQGTGCNWMCSYCADSLDTNNYYFTTPVCSYQSGGCVGNPIAGVQYTCCSN